MRGKSIKPKGELYYCAKCDTWKLRSKFYLYDKHKNSIRRPCKQCCISAAILSYKRRKACR